MMRFLHLLAAEDPSQTHHWLLPETAEIIYGGIASLIIFKSDSCFLIMSSQDRSAGRCCGFLAAAPQLSYRDFASFQ